MFTAADIPRFSIPSAKLFCDHTQESIKANGYAELLVKATCNGILPLPDPARDGFILTFSDHENVMARCVIIAIGGTNIHSIPRPFMKHMESGLIHHAFSLDYLKSNQATLLPHRTKLLVVGGGLTAAQLAIKAAKSNQFAEIVLASRGYLTERQFDVPLEWVSRRGKRLLASFYQLEHAKGNIYDHFLRSMGFYQACTSWRHHSLNLPSKTSCAR